MQNSPTHTLLKAEVSKTIAKILHPRMDTTLSEVNIATDAMRARGKQ